MHDMKISPESSVWSVKLCCIKGLENYRIKTNGIFCSTPATKLWKPKVKKVLLGVLTFTVHTQMLEQKKMWQKSCKVSHTEADSQIICFPVTLLIGVRLHFLFRNIILSDCIVLSYLYCSDYFIGEFPGKFCRTEKKAKKLVLAVIFILLEKVTMCGCISDLF